MLTYWTSDFELNKDLLFYKYLNQASSMSDLVLRVIELVVHSHSRPGVNEFRDRAALPRRAPPVGCTGELHHHQQLVVFQGD